MVEYTNEQNEAINEVDKNLRIIACAGSGKTRVLVGKIQHLLSNSNLNIKPKNILAFTFTEKAANELKSRTIHKLNNISGLADMFVGTIHGWSLNKLQSYHTEFQKYRVLDDIKLKIFVDKYYEYIGMKRVYKHSTKQPMNRFLDTSIFINIMNNLREYSFDQKDVDSNLLLALKDYENQLNKKRYFDFSMILKETLKALDNQNGDLYHHIKANIKFLFVDEYQDINPIQDKLIDRIREISGCKIFVVGDDDQNIYQWRGSSNKYIIDFHKKFNENDFKNISLNKNFRSSPGIVSLADNLIKNNKIRIPNKEMISADKQEYSKLNDIIYYDEYKDIHDETESIAQYIENIKGVPFSDNDDENRGIDYSDICILIRKWDKASSLMKVFDENDIPCITAGVNELFETPEIKATMGIFQFLNNDIEQYELEDLWNDVFSLRNVKTDLNIEKLKYAISGNDNRSIINRRPKKESKDWAYNLQEIFWDFLDLSGINEDIFSEKDKDKAELVFFNLGKFSQVINDFEEINFNSSVPSFHLFSFLSFIKYVAVDYYPEGWINNAYKTPNAVQIMTIHQSKGLEYPVVIIPGMNQNYFPAKRKGGLSEKHFVTENLYNQFQEFSPKTDLEDERRLLYVAITRSQKYLLITRAQDSSNRLYKKPSRFLYELPASNSIINVDPETLYKNIDKKTPRPKIRLDRMQIDFTTLKDYFECPYRFKLVSLYGFCYPLNQRMGQGQSFHNCLMDFHKNIKSGVEYTNVREIIKLVQKQEFYPYLNSSSRLRAMHRIVRNSMVQYCNDNKDEGPNIEFIEQDIQYQIDDNLIVVGRVDLIKKRKDNNQYETTIIEFKSKDEAYVSRITDDQLKMYALGHKELTGELANYINTYIIGENKQKIPKPVTVDDLKYITNKIKDASLKIKENKFEYIQDKDSEVCEDCLQNRLCVKNESIEL